MNLCCGQGKCFNAMQRINDIQNSKVARESRYTSLSKMIYKASGRTLDNKLDTYGNLPTPCAG